MGISYFKSFVAIIAVSFSLIQTIYASQLSRIEAEAENYLNKLIDDQQVSQANLRDLYKDVKLARQKSNWRKAIQSLEGILSVNSRDFYSWMKLSEAWVEYDPQSTELLASAYNAYLTGENEEAKAEALLIIATYYYQNNDLKSAVEFYQMVLKLITSEKLKNHLVNIESEIPQLRLDESKINVILDDKAPEICAEFNKPLVENNPELYKRFIKVSPKVRLSIKSGGNSLCFSGVSHGQKYKVSYLSGLLSKDGLELNQTVTRELELGDREKALSFHGQTLILPKTSDGNIPLSTLNISRVALNLLRISDRNLIEQIISDDVGGALSDWEIKDIVRTKGESVWQGFIDIAGKSNTETVTAIPIRNVVSMHADLQAEKINLEENIQESITSGFTDLVPDSDLGSGVYLLIAREADDIDKLPDLDELRGNQQTQWFVVTDTGLTAYKDKQTLLITAQSLSSGKPISGVEIQLIAKNNRILSESVTDQLGMAQFSSRLTDGLAGNALQAIFAQRLGEDFTFLNLSRNTLDLTDYDIEGHNIDHSLRAFIYSERELYRPGEQINTVAIIRDQAGLFNEEISQVPVTLSLTAPDGNRITSINTNQSFVGAREAVLSIPTFAQSGTWQVQAYLAKNGTLLGKHDIQVKDFVPDQIEMEISTTDKEALRPGHDSLINIQANYLYGEPSSELHGEAIVKLRQSEKPFAQYTDYKFGLEGDPFSQTSSKYRITRTDSKGFTRLVLSGSNIPNTTQPLEALIDVALVDRNGSQVKGAYSLPVRPDRNWIGVKLKSNPLPSGVAKLEFVYLDSKGRAIEAGKLNLSIVEEIDRFRWHRTVYNKRWQYKHNITDRLIKNDSLTINGSSVPVLEMPLEFGRYRIEIDDGQKARTSFRFQVGWSNQQNDAKPQLLNVLLNKPVFDTGEKAVLSFKSPFEGTASVIISNQGVLKTDNFNVSQGDNKYEFQVEDGWGPSVYALVTIYQPLDQKTPSGPPDRMLGMTHFSTNLSRFSMPLEIQAPEDSRPGPIEVIIDTGLPNQQDVFATISLVDDGIHSLTSFQNPDPIDYFLGKRQFGISIFDNYNQIIHSRGTERKLRSGAGLYGQLTGLGYTSKQLVSLHSGILRVEDDGTASHTFTIPSEFVGRVRINAIAWSEDKILTASQSVNVIRPIIAEVGVPRFLSTDDIAEVPIFLRKISTSGEFQATLTGSGGLEVSDNNTIIIPKDKKSTHGFVSITAKNHDEGLLWLHVRSSQGDSLIDFEHSYQIPIRSPYPATTDRLVHNIQPDDEINLSTTVQEFGFDKEYIEDSISYSARISSRTLFPGMPASALSDRTIPATDNLTTHANLLLTATNPEPAFNNTEKIKTDFNQAIAELLLMQNGDGGFSQTRIHENQLGNDESDQWLSAYTLDLLLRAHSHGHKDMISADILQSGVDYLKSELNQVLLAKSDDCPVWGAYTLFVLSREDQVSKNKLEHYHDKCISSASSPLSKALVASALAAFGGYADEVKTLFNQAINSVPVAKLSSQNGETNSDLRTFSMITALAFEARIGNELIPSIENMGLSSINNIDKIALAWFGRANHQLIDEQTQVPDLDIKVNGKAHTQSDGILDIGDINSDDFQNGITIKNLSNTNITGELFIRGVPRSWPGKQNQGFEIDHHFFDLNGAPVNLDSQALDQNQTLAVLVEGMIDNEEKGDALITQLLPGGLQIEDMIMSKTQIRLAGLHQKLDTSDDQSWAQIKFRDKRNDRFVAIIQVTEKSRRFKIAFLARAVTPGQYVVPPVSIEYLNAPEINGKSDSKKLIITAKR